MILFSAFNCSQLLLSCIKRTFWSINIWKNHSQYKMIKKKPVIAAAHRFRFSSSWRCIRIVGSNLLILVLFSAFNSSQLLISCMKRKYWSIKIWKNDSQYKVIEKSPWSRPLIVSVSVVLKNKFVSRVLNDWFWFCFRFSIVHYRIYHVSKGHNNQWIFGDMTGKTKL